MVTNDVADGLVVENARLRARLDHAEGELSARDAHHARWQAEKARADQAEATLERMRQFIEDMRTWCSPHGVAADYADRLLEEMDAGQRRENTTAEVTR